MDAVADRHGAIHYRVCTEDNRDGTERRGGRDNRENTKDHRKNASEQNPPPDPLNESGNGGRNCCGFSHEITVAKLTFGAEEALVVELAVRGT
jgi:hypothetical protein